jgi:hypothetical protein
VADLTRYFGEPLVILLSEKWKRSWPDFPGKEFKACIPDLEALSLMKRIDRIAGQLARILPIDRAWELQQLIIGPPLDEDGQPFNDGYWMLPLAAYWARYRSEDFEASHGSTGGFDPTGYRRICGSPNNRYASAKSKNSFSSLDRSSKFSCSAVGNRRLPPPTCPGEESLPFPAKMVYHFWK